MSQTLKIWKIITLLFFGLLVFLYILANTVAGVYKYTDPIFGFTGSFDNQNHLYVAEIIKGSPASQAGLASGDRVLAFNGIPLRSQDGLWELFKTINVREAVQVTVERNSRELNFSVPRRSTFSFNTSQILLEFLPGVLFCYTLFVVGFFVLLQKLDDRRAHIFYLMVMFWTLAMWHGFPFGSAAFLDILTWWIGYVRELFFPIAAGLLLHFSLVFPTEKTIFKNHRALAYLIMYGPVLLFFPYLYADLQGLQWADNVIAYGWTIWLGCLFSLTMSSMALSTAKASDPQLKNQSRFIYWATLITLALPTGLYFIPRNIFNYIIPGAEYLLLIMVLWPFLLGYAIIRHRMMDTRFIIKRGVAYAIVSGIVVAFYFVFVVVIGQVLLNFTGSTNRIITILATLFIASIFNPLKRRVQVFIDKKFFPNRFRYQEAVREFRHQLINVVDLQKLFDLLLRFLSDKMQIQSVAVLWNTGFNGRYTVRTSRGLGSMTGTGFTSQDEVVRRLRDGKRLVDVSPLCQKQGMLSEDEVRRWQDFRTELALPLLSKGHLSGLISLGVKEQEEPYYKEDIDVLETLSDQINISLENAMLTDELREQDRLKQELEVARRIQLSSLPQTDPQVDGLAISGSSAPALEVGGDYYDYLDFADGRFAVVLGDVSGKGTSAALYMAQLKGILHTASRHHKNLHGLFSEINAITFGNIEPTSFITLTCGAFDIPRQRLSLVRAGHLPMLFFSSSQKRCRQVEPCGIGIGLEQGKIFEQQLEEKEVRFKPGDIMIFFSDGINEAQDQNGEEFGFSRLEELIVRYHEESAFDIREKISEQVRAFSGSPHMEDDKTLVVVKIADST